MAKPRVVVTRPVPGKALERLRKQAEVVVWSRQRKITQEELAKFVRSATAIIPMLTEKIDHTIIDAAGPELKIVANYAVGFDNLDLKTLGEHNIYATNTPGVLTEAVAEHTMALLLAAARRIPEGDRFVRAGKYQHWEPSLLLGGQLYGKKIGIVGLGRIGMYVAQMAYSGFHMQVLYHDVARNLQFEEMFEAKHVRFETLLKDSDFITVHVPLLPSTLHLFGSRQFKQMKRTAVLVNTSRGPVVDEKALVAAIKGGQIAAAGLDVFECEPKLTAGLTKLERVVLTPHIASATEDAREQMAELAVSNVLAVLEGKKPKNLITEANEQ